MTEDTLQPTIDIFEDVVILDPITTTSVLFVERNNEIASIARKSLSYYRTHGLENLNRPTITLNNSDNRAVTYTGYLARKLPDVTVLDGRVTLERYKIDSSIFDHFNDQSDFAKNTKANLELNDNTILYYELGNIPARSLKGHTPLKSSERLVDKGSIILITPELRKRLSPIESRDQKGLSMIDNYHECLQARVTSITTTYSLPTITVSMGLEVRGPRGALYYFNYKAKNGSLEADEAEGLIEVLL